MKQKQNLKLRIERNGKVFHRYLKGKEILTAGRSPTNDIVLYGEAFPKRLRVFVPTASGYELRLTGDCRGEVIQDKSRLAFSDLLTHGLLPHHGGYPALPITPGKSGYLFFGDVRIDFAYDGAPVEEIRFAGFSPTRAFAKSLLQDPFFKVLLTALIIFHGSLLQWASQREIKRPEPTIELAKVQKMFAKYIPKLPEEPRVTSELNKTASATSASKVEGNKNKKNEGANTQEGEKKGYGADSPGEGVNLEKVGVLALIGGVGESAQGSNLMDALISRDLAKGIDQVMASGKNLSAGRGKTGTDVNALLAAGILGEGDGGNSSIEDILKNDITTTPSVKLQKTGTVSVEQLGKVSGSQEALGARTEESLRQVLAQNMGRLQYIYNKYLKSNPELRGKVELEVTINADGNVANVVILSSEISIPDFQRELVSAVRRWKYDAIAHGQVKVVYPILFVKVS